MKITPFAALLFGALAVLTACQKKTALEPLKTSVADFEAGLVDMRLESSSPIDKSTFAGFQRNIYKPAGNKWCVIQSEMIVRDGKIYRRSHSLSWPCIVDMQAKNRITTEDMQIAVLNPLLGVFTMDLGWRGEVLKENMVKHNIAKQFHLCAAAAWAGSLSADISAEDAVMSCERDGDTVSIVIQKSSTLAASRTARVHGESE